MKINAKHSIDDFLEKYSFINKNDFKLNENEDYVFIHDNRRYKLNNIYEISALSGFLMQQQSRYNDILYYNGDINSLEELKDTLRYWHRELIAEEDIHYILSVVKEEYFSLVKNEITEILENDMLDYLSELPSYSKKFNDYESAITYAKALKQYDIEHVVIDDKKVIIGNIEDLLHKEILSKSKEIIDHVDKHFSLFNDDDTKDELALDIYHEILQIIVDHADVEFLETYNY